MDHNKRLKVKSERHLKIIEDQAHRRKIELTHEGSDEIIILLQFSLVLEERNPK